MPSSMTLQKQIDFFCEAPPHITGRHNNCALLAPLLPVLTIYFQELAENEIAFQQKYGQTVYKNCLKLKSIAESLFKQTLSWAEFNLLQTAWVNHSSSARQLILGILLRQFIQGDLSHQAEGHTQLQEDGRYPSLTPRKVYLFAAAHFGVAITVMTATAEERYSRDNQSTLSIGEDDSDSEQSQAAVSRHPTDVSEEAVVSVVFTAAAGGHYEIKPIRTASSKEDDLRSAPSAFQTAVETSVLAVVKTVSELVHLKKQSEASASISHSVIAAEQTENAVDYLSRLSSFFAKPVQPSTKINLYGKEYSVSELENLDSSTSDLDQIAAAEQLRELRKN